MLDLRDLIHVLQGDLADCLMSGVLGTTDSVLAWFYPCRLQQQPCCRRSADIEVEGAIGAHCYASGNRDTGINVSCSGIEFLCRFSLLFLVSSEQYFSGSPYLAEIHAFDTFTTQSWTDGGTRAGLSGSHNELDDLVLG